MEQDYHSKKVQEIHIKFQDGSGFQISPYQTSILWHRCQGLEQELSVARRQIENLTELADLWKQVAQTRKDSQPNA